SAESRRQRNNGKSGCQPPGPPAAEPYADEYSCVEQKEGGIAAGLADEKCECQCRGNRGYRQPITGNHGQCGPGVRSINRRVHFLPPLRRSNQSVAWPSRKNKDGRSGPAALQSTLTGKPDAGAGSM